MIVTAHLAVGLALALLGWILLRCIARAGWAPIRAMMLDLAPVLIGWSVLTGMTQRPGFAGIVILALAGGLGLVDYTKRIVLREPVVFSDISELKQVFTHPELYLPFASRSLLYGGGALLMLAALALLSLEPPLWHFRLWPPALAGIVLAAVILVPSRQPLLGRAVAWYYRRLRPRQDPAANMVVFGTLGTILIHGMTARAERPERRRLALVQPAPAILSRPRRRLPPVVVIQSESFFDPRRLGSAIAPFLLPQFDRLGGQATARGRFGTSGWGANTMRSEFAVLSGLSDNALGCDRYNPYHAFAHAALPTLASRLKSIGYRTLALHPYTRSFYRRDKILPLLGFDRFDGIEAFADAPRQNGFVSDGALAQMILDELDDGMFIFAMTMENHGPWSTDAVQELDFDPAPGLPDTAAFRPLRRYLAGIRSADQMLGRVADGLASRGDGLLAFYGDHLPSLPGCFDACGFTETDADYLVWQPAGGSGSRQDIEAYKLSGLILEAALNPQAAPV